MTYLISQLWLYLLCAGLLGLLLGWIIWGWWNRRSVANARAEYERERLALESAFEADKTALREDRADAFKARDEALKVKASLLSELDGERKVTSEAKAQIGRLNQAELAARDQFERDLKTTQQKLDLERNTAAEAKKAVEEIRASQHKEIEGKQAALTDAEHANGALRAKLEKLEADSHQAKAALTVNLEDEQKAKAALQTDLQRERAELMKAKGAVDTVRVEMNREIEAKQTAATGAVKAAETAKRDAETARRELARFKTETMKANDEALKAVEQSLSDERRAKAALEVEVKRDRVELSEAKDRIEEIRGEMSRKLNEKDAALVAAESEANLKDEVARNEIARLRTTGEQSTSGQNDVDQLRLRMQQTIDGERKAKAAAEADRSKLLSNERELESEVARLRALLKQNETESAKTAKPKFTTDAPRPTSLFDRRPEQVDDLKEVKGIGPVMERVLNENGCYHFKQLANFSPRDIEWISQALGSFPDRIERDNWVGQAQTLYLQKYGKRHDVGDVRTLETVS